MIDGLYEKKRKTILLIILHGKPDLLIFVDMCKNRAAESCLAQKKDNCIEAKAKVVAVDWGT